MTTTIPAGEGWIAHAPGPKPECVDAYPEKYETLGRNGSIEHGFARSSWWEHAADRPELYIIAYRLACPVARERIAELEAEVERLRGACQAVANSMMRNEAYDICVAALVKDATQ